MRVLQIHKFFYPHAGSETVLFHTRALLTAHGHEVVDFAMEHPENLHSDQSQFFAPRREYVDATRSNVLRARDALSSVYSLSARRRLRALLNATRPDLAHIHIIYHQLTMSIVDELAHAGVPMAMTLHDYKIGCPAYVLYRDGAPCTDCVHGAVHNAVRHRCIKGSLAASTLAASEAALSRIGRKYQKIDAYVCPSAFSGQVATEAGVEPGRLHVVPNFLPDEEVETPLTALSSDPRFLYAGRLEEVKGLSDLLAAYESATPEMGTLVIAGAGGALESAVRRAAELSPQIEYLGRLSRSDVRAQLRAARATVLPSRWDENNPMSVLEARSLGVPVIVSDRGGLPEMVTDGVDGLVVEAGDAAALRSAIVALGADRATAETFGQAGYRRFLENNTAKAHYQNLLGAYESAIANKYDSPPPR